MLLILAISFPLSVLVARSIVSEADAHRRGQPDAWLSATCQECGGPLTLFTIRCRIERHRQRLTNAWIVFATVVLFSTAVFAVPSLIVWPAYAVFFASLVLLTVTDLDTQLIPNRILGPAIAISAVLLVVGWAFSTQSGSPIRATAAAVAYFAVMYALALIARGGLGYGDVKLALLIGMCTGFLGWDHVLVAGVSGFLVGGIVSIALLLSRSKGRKDAIPFGPFMAAGAVISFFWTAQIVTWYQG